MDVGGLLRGLGLGQYEDNFRENKIDADLLPRLTGDDLKEIGVFALGDRLRLLDAIAELAGAPPLQTFLPCRQSPCFPRVPKSRPSAAPSPSCSAISSGPQAWLRSLTPRIGARSSTPISTRPRRR
jgi:SAM domain (Sterile alpha motif)